VPCNRKDGAYFERRRRNNEAAKKSRDRRKCNEVETAQRAEALEKENSQLRTEVMRGKNTSHWIYAFHLLIRWRINSTPSTKAKALSFFPSRSAVCDNKGRLSVF